MRAFLWLGVGLGTLLLVGACNFGTPDEVTRQAPIATSVPGPTLIPVDPIPNAAKALSDGDFDTSRTLYSTAANVPAQKCEALYQLGMVELRSGKADVALNYFNRALVECPPTFRAYANRGEAYRALKQPTEAVSDYLNAIKLKPGVLDSYLYERMLLAGGADPTLLLRAVDAPRYLAGEFLLRNQYATQLLTNKAPLDALKQYEAILKVAQKPAFRAEVEVNAARAELSAGQTEAAYNRYNRVLTTYPDSPAALSALIGLVNDNQPVDPLVRTRINVRNGNYTPVPDFVTAYIADKTPEQIQPELLVLLGIAQRQTLPTPQTALDTLQGVRDRYPTSPQAAVAALEQGRTYFNAKDYLNAVNAYIGLVNAYPNAPEAPEALWRAGFLTQTYIDPRRAVTIYDLLVTRFPGTERARQAAFDAGLILYPTEPLNAAVYFGKTGDARGLLWQGKALLNIASSTAAAKSTLENAARAEPNSFWGQRARDYLDGRAPYQATGRFQITYSSEADYAIAETWLKVSFEKSAGVKTASTALSPALTADPMLIRGSELWALGWLREARAEFDALHELRRDDPLSMYQLAVYYRGIGVYRSSVIAAARVVALSNQPYSSVPDAILRLSYPIYYADLVTQEAKKYEIDPLFYSALIRLESLWESNARSVSDARGLTQVVPLTANDIFERLKFPPNFTTDDLYRPYISLRFGAYYVDFVRRFLDGNVAGTLAGYNAGPGAASKWLQQLGNDRNDIDRLYEIISSEEAQNYVRYTYENYSVYRYLYGR